MPVNRRMLLCVVITLIPIVASAPLSSNGITLEPSNPQRSSQRILSNTTVEQQFEENHADFKRTEVSTESVFTESITLHEDSFYPHQNFNLHRIETTVRSVTTQNTFLKSNNIDSDLTVNPTKLTEFITDSTSTTTETSNRASPHIDDSSDIVSDKGSNKSPFPSTSDANYSKVVTQPWTADSGQEVGITTESAMSNKNDASLVEDIVSDKGSNKSPFPSTSDANYSKVTQPWTADSGQEVGITTESAMLNTVDASLLEDIVSDKGSNESPHSSTSDANFSKVDTQPRTSDSGQEVGTTTENAISNTVDTSLFEDTTSEATQSTKEISDENMVSITREVIDNMSSIKYYLSSSSIPYEITRSKRSEDIPRSSKSRDAVTVENPSTFTTTATATSNISPSEIIVTSTIIETSLPPTSTESTMPTSNSPVSTMTTTESTTPTSNSQTSTESTMPTSNSPTSTELTMPTSNSPTSTESTMPSSNSPTSTESTMPTSNSTMSTEEPTSNSTSTEEPTSSSTTSTEEPITEEPTSNSTMSTDEPTSNSTMSTEEPTSNSTTSTESTWTTTEETTPEETTTEETTPEEITTPTPTIPPANSIAVDIVAGILGLMLLGGLLATGAVMYHRGKLPWNPRNSNATVRPQPISLSKFETHCNELLNTPARLGSEYQLLQTLSTDVHDTNTVSAAQLPDNKRKNRYCNILPYDLTRVKLDITNDDPSSDYINASFIKGFSNNVEYIASQGPKEETVVDFWRMIHQHDVQLIVMVTNLEEGGKIKCDQYIPKLREQMTCGEIVIRCTTELNFSIHTQRTIVVHKDDTKRTITHLHFNEWPDFGCPAGTDSMLQFCQTLRHHVTMLPPGLILVHCSAGVGRTGTLIATDILLQHVQVNKKVDVFGTVFKLRKQRLNMVQTIAQYAYIYKCIRDAILDPTFLKPESPHNSTEPIYENVQNGMTTFSITYEKLPQEKEKSGSSENFELLHHNLMDQEQSI